MKPTKGTTRSKTGSRRSHHALKAKRISVDEQGNPRLPHRASPSTGLYKGNKAVDVEKRATRLAKRRKALS